MTALAMAALPPAERERLLATLTRAELDALPYTWAFWARPDQMPPPPLKHELLGTVAWRFWLLLAGRGAGKTRSAAEWVRDAVESGRRRSIGIIGPTADTLRRDIVEGESGLIRISPPWCQAVHEPSQRRIVWPNGAVAYLLSSEEPDRVRGPNLDGFWGDELTSWANAQACWDNLQFALRITGPKGDAPAGVISTTPKRHALLRAIMADPATAITHGCTFDNAANLDAGALAALERRYGGTSLGRQELMGELLEDAEGALWQRDQLDACRVHTLPEMRRIVVAVDPAGGSSKRSDETGIVACGVALDGRGYVLADASGRYTPDGWARAAVNLYRSLKADRIVAEQNYGGAMVEATIRAVDGAVPVKMVVASRGKQLRAEPVSALYEQRRVSHIGNLPELEDQMCGWNPAENGPSPDRVDALVWALTELMVEEQPRGMHVYSLFDGRLLYDANKEDADDGEYERRQSSGCFSIRSFH
jgi:phage terminase large subunit-like protein